MIGENCRGKEYAELSRAGGTTSIHSMTSTEQVTVTTSIQLHSLLRHPLSLSDLNLHEILYSFTMADTHRPTLESKDDPDRQTASEIHHLYFEDNDSFFPPSWLGKEGGPRRPSTESTDSTVTSHDMTAADREGGKPEQTWYK